MAYLGYQPPDRFNSAFKRQSFTGNGTMGPFVLDLAVVDGSEQGVEVFVGNVRQEPTVAYTIGGTGNNLNKELLFTESPDNGESIYVIHKGDTTLAISVPDNFITNNKLADNAVTGNKILDDSITPAKTSFLKDNTNNSAIFEVDDSSNKGTILTPKMTETQRDAISNPATALVIYNTDKNKLNIYNGTQWEELGGGDGPQSQTNAADIFTNFVKDMEDHGRTSMHTEAGFVDELEAPNDMIDESNSSGFGYDATGDFYTNNSTGVINNVEYTTESNYLQQEWTNQNQSTSQATVAGGTTVTLSSGTWLTNCDNGRISFDSGSTWFDISSRNSNTELTLASAATNGTFDYVIRLSEFDSGSVKLNDVSGNNPINVSTSIVTSESHNSNVTNWTDINSASITETGSGDAHYWLGFDPATGYGPGTEAKIYQFKTDNNTKLLMNFNNNLNDESSNTSASNWTTGDVAFSSGVTKFGSHSLEFSSGGGNAERFLYNTNPTSSADDILNSDTWTVEFWYRQDYTITPPQDSDTISIINIAPEGVWFDATPRGICFEIDAIRNIFYVYTSGTTAGAQQDNLVATGIGPTANTWIHYAVTFENGNLIKVYVDGNLKVSQTIDAFTGTSTNAKFQFGERGVGNNFTIFGNNDVTGHKAYIDDFRASTDLKYTSNFTPPTSEFFEISNGWKTIAKNNAGTWEYNTAESLYVGTASTTNDMLHAVSQAIQSHSFNRMTETQAEAITDAEFEASNGFDSSTHTSLFRGVTLQSTNVSNNISVDSYGLNYDFNSNIDLRTKQWTGSNGTPSAPSESPDIMYLFVVDEQTSGTPQYAVTRNGSTYTNVTFDRDWIFDGTKRARRATIDVSSQPAGTDPRMKVTNSNTDDFKLHAVGLQTKK